MQDRPDERSHRRGRPASDPPDEHRARWESEWSRPEFDPRWRARTIPDEIRQVVDQGWFPPREFVLDIGCGSGEIAAWLAGQGYEVVGIDFSRAAIARAQREHREVEGVTFEEADITRQALGPRRFSAILDRGCLQGVPQDARPDYIRNVAGAAKAGAAFLLLHRILPDTTRADTVRNIETLCKGAFEVVHIAETVLARDPATSQEMPGVAFYMTRS